MARKKKIIVGNWKMNPVSRTAAVQIFSGIVKKAAKYKNTQAIICPPYVLLESCAAIIKKNKISDVSLGAQNLFSEPEGAYTGEISGALLADAGVQYVIVGHSERRKMGETDETVNKKMLTALKAGLRPIVCIGEERRDEDGQYLGYIKSQLEKALVTISEKQLSKIVIAYEPVWAIGAKSAMDAHSVHEMMIFIKRSVMEIYKVQKMSVPILYGGSVDPTNAGEILDKGEADGLLVGRQSLTAQSFGEILQSASNL